MKQMKNPFQGYFNFFSGGLRNLYCFIKFISNFFTLAKKRFGCFGGIKSIVNIKFFFYNFNF